MSKNLEIGLLISRVMLGLSFSFMDWPNFRVELETWLAGLTA